MTGALWPGTAELEREELSRVKWRKRLAVVRGEVERAHVPVLLDLAFHDELARAAPRPFPRFLHDLAFLEEEIQPRAQDRLFGRRGFRREPGAPAAG